MSMKMQQSALHASVSPRIKIVLGEKPSVTHCNPFYLMSKEAPQEAPLTGASNLIRHHDLEQTYSMYCTRRLREELSCFLPGLPGQVDTNGSDDGSSLLEMIERPPVTGKDLAPLSANALSAFRLHEGPVPPELAQLFNKPPTQNQQQQQQQQLLQSAQQVQQSQQQQQAPGRTRKRRHEAMITDMIGSSYAESSSSAAEATTGTSAPVASVSSTAAPSISRFAAGVPPLPPPPPLPTSSVASTMPTAAMIGGTSASAAAALAAAKSDKAERKAERKRKKEKKRKTKERV